MKWFAHTIIPTAPLAVFSPESAAVMFVASTAPDWLEWILPGTTHRGPTHYLAIWAAGCAVGWFVHPYVFVFFLGGFIHVFLDACTVSGVPFGWWSGARFHLFGGRLRTGDPAEYVIACGVFALSAMAYWNLDREGLGWYPFFWEWHEFYAAGILDGAEWRERRFKIF